MAIPRVTIDQCGQGGVLVEGYEVKRSLVVLADKACKRTDTTPRFRIEIVEHFPPAQGGPKEFGALYYVEQAGVWARREGKWIGSSSPEDAENAALTWLRDKATKGETL